MRISEKPRHIRRMSVRRTTDTVSQYVSRCLQLAILLEVSAYPKPGNVHRTSNFEGTRFEHFLASAVALMPHLTFAADQGRKSFEGRIHFNRIGLGRIIKQGVVEVNVWQHGGNTLLGSVILLIPMATAAGLTLAQNPSLSLSRLRLNLKRVVETTSANDAVNLYDAIALAQPGGLGKSPQLDVNDAESRKELLDRQVSLLEVLRISAPWDSISREWATNYHVTFDIGYPFITQQLTETRDINTATIHTYLKILSEVPDTLIQRKVGIEKAKWVSDQAKQILEVGGMNTSQGKRKLRELDLRLHDAHHKLNPGTTADLVSSVLAVAILEGYRP